MNNELETLEEGVLWLRKRMGRFMRLFSDKSLRERGTQLIIPVIGREFIKLRVSVVIISQ